MIVSGGEQTINFNLTQEDNEDDDEIKSDEELDIGDEIPTENTNRARLNIPESKIY